MDGAGPSSWPILGTTTPRGYQNPEKNRKNLEEKKSLFLFASVARNRSERISGFPEVSPTTPRRLNADTPERNIFL